MRIKDKLLVLLQENKERFLSGEAIAETLNVTRSAVWKAIVSLRNDGFEIVAQTNNGYKLSSSNDKLTESGICSHLRFPLRVEVMNSATSTNALLFEKRLENEGYVLAANEQTQGVGRRGRRFFSPKDSGIYFSVLLKPDLAADEYSVLTCMAAVAVCDAIKKFSDKPPKIKWINDVFIGNKKVCGILTQALFSIESQKAEFVVIGIGLNVYSPQDSFDESIKDIADSVFTEKQGDLKNRLLAEILNCFFDLYYNFNKDVIVQRYKDYCFVIGKQVDVIFENGTAPATVLDLNDKCNLIVRYADGRQDILSSCEISVKKHCP